MISTAMSNVMIARISKQSIFVHSIFHGDVYTTMDTTLQHTQIWLSYSYEDVTNDSIDTAMLFSNHISIWRRFVTSIAHS